MAWETDPTNVVGRRVVASLIDGTIAFVPAALAFTATLTHADGATRDRLGTIADPEDFCDEYLEQEDGGFCFHADDTVYYTDSGIGVIALVLYGIALLLHVLLQGLTGWTVGKLITGIRTVRQDGSRVGIPRAALRWVLWIVDGLPAFALVGFITALTTNGHRRVGDMVAKTFVVRAAAAGQPVLVPGVTAPPGAGAPGAWPTPGPVATTGPQWDEARSTYIQWDPELRSWMQWDEAASRWDPIPGQDAIPPPPPPPAPPAPPAPPPPAPPPPPSPPAPPPP